MNVPYNMDWTTVDSMQVDLTSHCNARCGACTRNVNGGPTVPGLSLNHFSVDIWNRLFTQDLKDVKIRTMVFNGMWGDAGMHPYFPKMLDTLHDSHPEVSISSIATNGGTHNPLWWGQLARSLSKFKYHRVDFAIDGLADTHGTYRRKVSYDRLLANAQEFINNGGEACWIMTVFDHNRHQIQEAAELSKKMGFTSFRSRQSNATHILVEDGDVNYTITTDNCTSDDYIEVDYGSAMSPREVKSSSTGCPWYNNKRIQLDPWHNIWPCCHIASHVLEDQYIKMRDPSTGEKYRVKEFSMQDEVYDVVDSKTFNNLDHHSFMEILDHPWYQKTLSKKIEDKSLIVCEYQCGIKNDGVKVIV